MTDYTPTTEEVRAEYVSQGWAPDGSLYGENDPAEFDRWYADVIRKAKAEAWDEGAEATAMTVPEALWHTLGLSLPPNPYTEES